MGERENCRAYVPYVTKRYGEDDDDDDKVFYAKMRS